MCILIVKDSNKVISNDILVASAHINQHGLGVLWLDNWRVTYHESNDYVVLDTDRPFIAHFRYATIGKISRENCHPFNINDDEILFQNGTVHNLGNKDKTDTQHMAELLKDIPKDRWCEVLEMTECRFVTANLKERTYELYNEYDWIEHDGINYSKENVLNQTLVAVYGTLKKGYSNYHHHLSTAKYVGPGETLDKYPLIIDGLPYLLNKQGVGNYVEVDLFLVDNDTFKMLDQLESHPTWYYRERINIDTKDGTVMSAFVYFNDTVDDTGVHHKTYTQEVSGYSSHDEVVYGKKSLLGKMPGDEWQRFANLRLLYAYMYTHPGTKLIFQGGEFGQSEEWNFSQSLDWHLLEFKPHKGLQTFVKDLNSFYKTTPALYEKGFSGDGFEWINYGDHENSVISYIRKGHEEKDDVVVLCNFNPVIRKNYEIGLPRKGKLKQILNSDFKKYFGSGISNSKEISIKKKTRDGRPYSAAINLPPLSLVAFKVI